MAANVIRLPAMKKNPSVLHALDNAEINTIDPTSEDSSSSSSDKSEKSSSDKEDQGEEDLQPAVLTPPSTGSKKWKRKDLGE